MPRRHGLSLGDDTQLRKVLQVQVEFIQAPRWPVAAPKTGARCYFFRAISMVLALRALAVRPGGGATMAAGPSTAPHPARAESESRPVSASSACATECPTGRHDASDLAASGRLPAPFERDGSHCAGGIPGPPHWNSARCQ